MRPPTAHRRLRRRLRPQVCARGRSRSSQNPAYRQRCDAPRQHRSHRGHGGAGARARRETAHAAGLYTNLITSAFSFAGAAFDDPWRRCDQPRNHDAGQRLRSDRRAGRRSAACICARRSGVRRSVKQNRALPLAETARLACVHGLTAKPRACRSTEHDDGRALHGAS